MKAKPILGPGAHRDIDRLIARLQREQAEEEARKVADRKAKAHQRYLERKAAKQVQQ